MICTNCASMLRIISFIGVLISCIVLDGYLFFLVYRRYYLDHCYLDNGIIFEAARFKNINEKELLISNVNDTYSCFIRISLEQMEAKVNEYRGQLVCSTNCLMIGIHDTVWICLLLVYNVFLLGFVVCVSMGYYCDLFPLLACNL